MTLTFRTKMSKAVWFCVVQGCASPGFGTLKQHAIVADSAKENEQSETAVDIIPDCGSL